MRHQFKRDFNFWDAKHTKAMQESYWLRSQIVSREFYAHHFQSPKKRYPGSLREVRVWSGEIPRKIRTNRRQFCYRRAALWRRHYTNWLCRVTKLRKFRERKKMLDTTKIPYYRQRIESLGHKPSWQW